MTVANNVFPQAGDADFAENFATWLGRGNISSYVETGLGITPNYTTSPPTVDISQGKSFIIIDEETISSNGETRLALDYAVTTEGATSVTINSNESNNLIYLNPNLGTNDSPSFEVETSTSGAAADWLLIARVDTVAESVEQLNRNPDADFDTLTARESFGLPVYSELSEASSSEASTIYIDGSGTPRQGVYVNNGGSFTSVGVKEISQLTDVTGVDSITADSATNRPAAGTTGRIFIDTTNEKIQYDTGSVWEDIGINADNIGAGDLGFNTATQAELDSHISVTDAHHTPPAAGNGLKSQSNDFNIEPEEFTGSFLSDDGTDNIQVNIGDGLSDDGANNLTLTNDSVTVSSGTNLVGGGIVSLGESITIDHEDTSTQSSISAVSGAAVTGVDIDGNGHVTSLSTADFDSRFVKEVGDTISGDLAAPSFTLEDSSNDGSQWSLSENPTNGNLRISDGSSTRIDLDNSGNIRIEGELTEGSSL
jgi:hypothetical protein